MEMLLIETVGPPVSNAGEVVHVQPVAGKEAIDLIVDVIRHEATDLVTEAWNEWAADDGDWADDFTLRMVNHRHGTRVFTVVGSARQVDMDR